MTQHRSSKYFPQFENQGIDPEGGSSSLEYLHKHKQACTQRFKEVVNPFKIVCKVRSEGGKCNEVKSVRLKIWCGVDPGGHRVH